MTDRDENVLKDASSMPTKDLDWEQEKTKVRVRQFMNILEQLPRLCSPTICGTLSQPTTRTERATRGADMFEWSLEQKAILSPANITTDTDETDDWQNVADLNLAWRQQESDMFFSQRTIAPSPSIATPRVLNRPLLGPKGFQDLLCEDEEDDLNRDDRDEDNNQKAQDLTTSNKNQSAKTMSYEFEDDHHFSSIHSEEEHIDDDITDNDDGNHPNDSKQENQDDMMDNLFFSPQPLKSSQTQQRMDVFSPDTFSRVMDDENTLQSTPKTTGSTRIRNRNRAESLLD